MLELFDFLDKDSSLFVPGALMYDHCQDAGAVQIPAPSSITSGFGVVVADDDLADLHTGANLLQAPIQNQVHEPRDHVASLEA